MPDPLESPHLKLPYLAAAQAQKHVTHNEALKLLDTLVQLAVLDSSLTAPPASPDDGDRYIVAGSATGGWDGHDGAVATWVDGAWQFAAPEIGWLACDAAAATLLVRGAGGWQAIGAFLGAVDRFGINATADGTNRLAVRSAAVLFSAIEAAGGGSGDIRFVVNKEADADTASLLFQSGWSGRAEVGLAGDTDFVFKVSPDGAAWVEAIRIDKDTGLAAILYDNAASGLAATTVQDAIDEVAAGSGGGGSVASVFGRTGAVAAAAGDYAASEVDNDSSVSGTSVKDALNALATGIAGKQDSDADLAALAGVSATGLVARTGAGTAAARSIAGSNGVAITNGDGVAGNPTVSLTAPTAFASINTGPIGGWRNLLINPDGRFNQRAPASNADDTYGHDRWYALTQTGTIAVSTVSDAENGTPRMWRLTQSQAAAQRMGYAQIIEGGNCKHLRGRNVTLSGRVRVSLNAALRYAILEWTGTEDAVTSDVVNAWTNGTFTAGQFFNATTLNVLAVGTITPAAATLTDLTALTAAVGASCNNLIVFIWTEGTAAQNATLDGALQLEVGSAASLREFRPVAAELMLCQRTFQFLDGFTGGWPTSATTLTASGHFPVEMRVAPTAAIHNGTNSALRYQVATYNISAIAGNGLNPTGGYVDLTTASAAVGALGSLIASAISADAEL